MEMEIDMRLNIINVRVIQHVTLMAWEMSNNNLDREQLTNFIIETIEEFMEFDGEMVEEGNDDVYENIEKFYKDKLFDLYK